MNSRLDMVNAPALEAGAEPLSQERLIEIRAVGPQADKVALASALHLEPDLQLGVGDEELVEYPGPAHVGLDQLPDGELLVVSHRLQLHLPPALPLRVAEVQRLHADHFHVGIVRERIEAPLQMIE